MNPKASTLPILVVEDEPSVMSFLQAALERKGYQTVTSKSGAEALKMLEKAEFRGVITDMRTPGGVSGADVHAWIKANRPQLADRVIVVTGDTVNEETVAILRKTQAPVVEKPFRVQQLLQVVERVLGKAV